MANIYTNTNAINPRYLSNKKEQDSSIVYRSVIMELRYKIKIGSSSTWVESGWKQLNLTEHQFEIFKYDVWDDFENKIRETLLDFYWKNEDQRLNREYRILEKARNEAEVYFKEDKL